MDLIDATPIQSVFEPSRYTQDKNMWWNVEVNHEKGNWGINLLDHPNTIPVALEVRGVNCQSYGVQDLAYALNDLTPTAVQYRDITAGRALAPNVEQWHECPYEYRTEMTWAPSESVFGGAKIFTGTDGKSAAGTVKVYTLEFDMEIDPSTGEGSAVLPFDSDNIETHLDMWVRPAEPDDDNYLTDDDGNGMVKWKVIVDPDNTVNENPQERTDNRESSEEETIYFDDDSYDVMVVRTRLKYKACDDWKFFGWDECLDRDTYTLEEPSIEQAEEAIDLAESKMQEMYPIPEGRLNIYLMDGYAIQTTTEHETINDWVGNLIQRTMSAFDLISNGIQLGEQQTNPPDRVIMLTHHDVASSWEEGTGNSISKSDRMFGAMAFGGIAPCSSSAIVAKSGYGDTPPSSGHDIESTADTIIHELGHTMLVGHDNSGYFTSTINDCGLESAYQPGVKATGWTPQSISDTSTWWDGQSFMRYPSDADSTEPLSEFEFDENWIQNVDYELIQDMYSEDSGADFMSRWGEVELGSLMV